MFNVHLYNITGTALAFGVDQGNGTFGFRESRIRDVKVYRCGSSSRPAVLFQNGLSSFGANSIYFYGCEVSVWSGVGLKIVNNNVSNDTHTLFFFGLKMHGTGNDNSHYPPLSGPAIVIQGKSENSISFYGLTCVQAATQVGQFAIELVGNSTGFPQNILFDGSLENAQNGIRIEGGSNIDIRFLSMSGVNGIDVEVGDGVSGPVYLDVPNAGRESLVVSSSRVSHHVRFKNAPFDPKQFIPWLWQRSFATVARSFAIDATPDNIPFLSVTLSAVGTGERFQFSAQILFSTTATAGLKYSVFIAGGALNNVYIEQRHRKTWGRGI